MKRVVITGMGVISPLGNDVHTFWKHLTEGKSGISLIDSFDVSGSKTKIAGTVRDFDAEERWGRKEARRLDRFSQFALAAAEQALESSGIQLDQIDRERLGVYVGSGIGGITTLIDNVHTLNERGARKVSPSLVPMMISNAAAAQISIRLGALGPSLSPVTACSIGNTSIGEAFNAIRNDDADIMFAGGAEAAITNLSLASFGNAHALSARNEDPAAASRPFDADRDGFVMSEGAGILVLESLDSAIARNAPILCEVLGYGASSDAYHMVASHPEGTGAYLAMKNALKKANVSAEDIDVVSAHATSTKAGDLSETLAIKTLFGELAYDIPVTANKSMLGHMLGAAGGVEAIALTESLRHGIIPPTINLQHPDSACDLDYVADGPRQQSLTIGLSNSFGFGGHNSAIVLKKYE
ncbi:MULTISPECIES: beta-ketoacyl-ACP synthase II [Bacillus]|uniref:beta-ketoacyl-ACP synthase II n=1 Tax=Bacillus TaxID=1386 RepID=UPI0005917B60|nr:MULTISPECIES: beta-ketoacyl-ACP synthase II [Bacillus]KMO07467.1 3-oxoacyl-ACP synthase [Bacillus amyloliquefaciens]MBR7817759.1 beta-ketoacyl-ACP synthase II [Bacillus sp. CCNWLCWHY013]MCM3445957.1 beta-ketoacyl-ACP synthase II [Bacillus velezensis]MCP9021769.1 beta-ketoacyl-ACP synthase II [Bacillus velezensis]MDE5155517.1 beta-ketoacyl-ACP synthase II [Bacillus amyloliquefaciens]